LRIEVQRSWERKSRELKKKKSSPDTEKEEVAAATVRRILMD
jgi:hypothetical protein